MKTKIPYGKNNLSSKNIFNERKFYEDESLKSVVDFNIKKVPFEDFWLEKNYYGIFDENLNVIYPKQQYSKLFIENFDLMSDYFRRGIETGLLKTKNSKYIKLSMRERKFTSLQTLISNNIIRLTNSIESYLKSNKIVFEQIKTFDDFIQFIIESYQNRTNLSLSLSSIVMNNPNKALDSGLITEINRDSYDDDESKYKNYITDHNFPFFSECCLRFGFSIDQNIPWRILLDIKSPFNLLSAKNLLEEEYVLVYTADLASVKQQLFSSYNNLVENNKYIINHGISSFERKKIEKIPDKYDNYFWIRFYALIRAVESNSTIEQLQFNNLVLQAQELYEVFNIEKSIKHLDNFFKVENFSNLTAKFSSDRLSLTTIRRNLVF